MKRAAFIILVVVSVSLSVQAKYSGGTGTTGNPYRIGSTADLFALAANTGDYGANFVLTADIDLTGQTFMTAVIAPDVDSSGWDFNGVSFTGVFDGNDHQISNLTINTSEAGNDFLGLFGQIGSGSQVKNLGLINVSVTDGDGALYIGGLVGNSDRGTVNDCDVTGTVVGGSDSTYLGVLVGCNTSGTVSHCYATGTVGGGDGSECLGVLVGYNSGCNYGAAIVTDCCSTGYVNGGGSSVESLGGLIGENDCGTISSCYSTADVNGENSSQYLGGLAGYNDGTISDCYSTAMSTAVIVHKRLAD